MARFIEVDQIWPNGSVKKSMLNLDRIVRTFSDGPTKKCMIVTSDNEHILINCSYDEFKKRVGEHIIVYD